MLGLHSDRVASITGKNPAEVHLLTSNFVPDNLIPRELWCIKTGCANGQIYSFEFFNLAVGILKVNRLGVFLFYIQIV